MLLSTADEIDAIQVSLLRTMASVHRLRIIHLLGNGSLEVHELADQLGLQQAATSQHLAAMRAAGLVEGDRDGRAMRYRLTDSQINTACELMRDALVRRLSRLGDLAAQVSASSDLALASNEVRHP
jgi:DNA-binding transcriptional ArsR family regulator